MAGVIQLSESQFHHSFAGPFPYGSVDHSRLTEAAASGAASESLHHSAVVNGFNHGYDGIHGKSGSFYAWEYGTLNGKLSVIDKFT